MYVIVKGVTARVATVSKEKMYRGATKTTNNKVNKAGGGEGEPVFYSLGKKAE